MSWRWLDLVSHSQQQGKAAELEQEHQQLQPQHGLGAWQRRWLEVPGEGAELVEEARIEAGS